MRLDEVRFLEEMEAPLVELAKSGELCVTDLLQLPKQQREWVGMTLLGQYYDEGTTSEGMRYSNVVNGRSVPPELRDCKVKIEGIGRTIAEDNPRRGKLGAVIGRARDKQISTRKSASYGLEERPAVQTMLRDEEREIDLDEQNQAEIDLPTAWLLLRQCGQGCVYAKGIVADQRVLCREVRAAPKGKRKMN